MLASQRPIGRTALPATHRSRQVRTLRPAQGGSRKPPCGSFAGDAQSCRRRTLPLNSSTLSALRPSRGRRAGDFHAQRVPEKCASPQIEKNSTACGSVAARAEPRHAAVKPRLARGRRLVDRPDAGDDRRFRRQAPDDGSAPIGLIIVRVNFDEKQRTVAGKRQRARTNSIRTAGYVQPENLRGPRYRTLEGNVE